jgi:threonine/homoserine/homoserine lactone efflux protein
MLEADRLPAMGASEWLALLGFATVMAFTPGPNTTLSAALGAQGGLRAAMPFVLSVPVGWGLLLLASVAGLGALLEAMPGLRHAVKLLGLAALLWLAWQLAQRRSLAQAEDGLRVGFAQGVALQFVNIKAWMNALLISAGWITVADNWMWRAAAVLPVMMLYGLCSNLSYALVGAALRHWLSQGRRLLVFNRVLAAVLVATAFWMAAL